MKKQITIKEIKDLVGKSTYNNNEFANWLLMLLGESAEACELKYPDEDFTKGYIETIQKRRDRLYNRLDELGFFD